MLEAQMRFYLKINSFIFFQLIKSCLLNPKCCCPGPSCTLQVNRLMERVEHAFIKHFANGNHRKGMNTLRPTAKKERHRITFLLGKGTKKWLNFKKLLQILRCICIMVNIEQ